MDLERYVEGLPRPVVVEAVYLAGRYLSHRFKKEEFLKQVQAETALPEAVQAALKIVAAIERAEGRGVDQLSPERSHAYARELDRFLPEDTGDEVDDAEADEALSVLRSMH